MCCVWISCPKDLRLHYAYLVINAALPLAFFPAHIAHVGANDSLPLLFQPLPLATKVTPNPERTEDTTSNACGGGRLHGARRSDLSSVIDTFDVLDRAHASMSVRKVLCSSNCSSSSTFLLLVRQARFDSTPGLAVDLEDDSF